ncbi:MAG: DUF692 family protein [Bacteroidetes bacterium]|nr:DUF692 family protein [Bacteroidota bacterium]
MVPLIATPISDLFDNPADAERIIAASDCLEGRDKAVDALYPPQQVFHFDYQVIHPWIEDRLYYIQNVIEKRPDLKLLTFQASSSFYAPVLIDKMYQPGGKQYQAEEMLEFAEENLRWLKEELSGSATIAVENNNFYPTEAYHFITQPSFLKELVHSNDIGFLFDMAHARVTAHNKYISYEDYCNGLPLDRLEQIHISKHAVDENGMAYDAHEIITQDEFDEVNRLIREYDPNYLTIEYYRNTDELLNLLDNLKRSLHERLS